MNAAAREPALPAGGEAVARRQEGRSMSAASAPAATRLALGLGCDRGTPAATITRAIDAALARIGASRIDVAAVASITLKADEAGLLETATAAGWTLRFYPPAVLAAVDVPNPSETVRRHTGTPSVSEAAALLAAGTALATDPGALRVEKHKLRGPDGRNATVSIARLPAPSPAPN